MMLQPDGQFSEGIPVGEPDRVLRGQYWDVNCYQIDGSRWHFSPLGSPVGRYETAETDEEAIAYIISITPLADNFISMRHIDQVIQWINYRDRSTDLALCFWGERETDSDALLKQLEAGEIDNFSYRYAWAEADIYRPLWQCVKANAANIEAIWRKQGWSYPWQTRREFFAEIVQDVLEREFRNCLRPNYIYNASEIDTIAKLKRRQHKGKITESELKKLHTLIDKTRCFSEMFDRLICIVEALSKQDEFANRLFQQYRDNLDLLAKLQIQRECSPELRRIHRRPSETWNRGNRTEGLKPWNA